MRESWKQLIPDQEIFFLFLHILVLLKPIIPKTTVVSKSTLFSLDTVFLPWYSNFSDRVADTCEARDLEKLPRELFSLYGGFYVRYKR